MKIILIAALLLPLPILAQEPPPPPPAGTARPENDLWDLIRSAAGPGPPRALFHDCFRGFTNLGWQPPQPHARRRGQPGWPNSDVGQMYTLCRTAPNLFTNGLLPGLRKLNPDDPGLKPDMEAGIAGRRARRPRSA